jgi:hypothetical protein
VTDEDSDLSIGFITHLCWYQEGRSLLVGPNFNFHPPIYPLRQRMQLEIVFSQEWIGEVRDAKAQ